MNQKVKSTTHMDILLMSICILALLPTACGQTQNSSNDQIVKKSVSVAQLEGREDSALVMQNALARPSHASDVSIIFSGELSFSETELNSSVPRSSKPLWLGEGQSLFPSFSIEMVSDGQNLIPFERGIISTWQNSNSFWDVIVGVGRIWYESEDGHWQRASIPISLVSRKLEQLKNCVALFLYDDTTVSYTTIQCSQETCSATGTNTQDDMHASVPTQYVPQEYENGYQIISNYQDELLNQLPIWNWSRLDPEGDVEPVFSTDMSIGGLSLGAVVMDEEIYLQPQLTRHGAYPYPLEMRHSVFSVSKSLCGMLALLYLAQRYGDEIFDALITDYIPALRNLSGWQGVTFEDVANMATGTAEADTDEFIRPFYVQSASAEECIATIASFPDLPGPPPGKVFQYASTHYFVLSYAMQAYTLAQDVEDVHFWELVEANVLRPIGVEHLALQMTEEPDGSKGLPIFGGGAFPTVDEAAKIALLFNNNGEYQGQALLHRERTMEALGRGDWQGYDTGSGSRYRHSFWSRQYSGGDCPIDVSYMSGHGGNFIGFLPSGLIILRFADANVYNYEALTHAVEDIRSSCVR